MFDSEERKFDSEEGGIPLRLDDMEPGPVLAGFLASIEVANLSGYDRIVVLRAHQRMASHYNAHVYGDMAAVADHMNELDDDYLLATEAAAAEIRVALRLTRRAADCELGFALELHRRLPAVRDALSAGDIDLRRAKTIVFATTHLPAATARSVVDQIIARAPQLTTGQLAARIRRLCIEADPVEAKRRYEQAIAERRVVTESTEAGTANLLGYDLAPHLVTAAANRINELAKSLRRPGESRSMDQLRADVLLDMLLGTNETPAATSPRGVVDITVDLETLTRLTDAPGELAGYGPVIADIARQVTEQHDAQDGTQQGAEWRYTLTDPANGRVLQNGITRRRPTVSQRRYVQARNPTCVFPGCRMPATRSDVDHRIPYAEGGPTEVTHLAPACRHDHCVRHRHGWTYRPLPGGDYQWTTKVGHTYTTSGAPP